MRVVFYSLFLCFTFVILSFSLSLLCAVFYPFAVYCVVTFTLYHVCCRSSHNPPRYSSLFCLARSIFSGLLFRKLVAISIAIVRTVYFS
ncbi:hypothetical protein BDV93DRAFT_93546 [Ceratobasidium sp. AG-I]|nr:hypothetical protein BDV93DRAFT_93546 [Ceratobasidium sp. AG-I]